MIDMNQPDDKPLGYLLYRVTSALRPEVAAALTPIGLALPQYICLRILSMTPDRSNAELARDTNVSPQAMHMVLRGLQDAGAVERPPTVSSGRALPARLTSDGRALLKRADAAVRGAEDRLLGNLTVQERREFRRILAVIGTPDG
jgi:DNA-binding MarR family transcriptional regulator